MVPAPSIAKEAGLGQPTGCGGLVESSVTRGGCIQVDAGLPTDLGSGQARETAVLQSISEEKVPPPSSHCASAAPVPMVPDIKEVTAALLRDRPPFSSSSQAPGGSQQPLLD